MDVYALLDYQLICTTDDSLGVYRVPYIVFNYLESAAWTWFALRSLVRHRAQIRFHRVQGYAFAFALFALSDLIETQGTTTLLLLFKLGTLLAILALRRLVNGMALAAEA